jgi:DNA-dependent RNA polymerase auxiliary subunit epsilon
MRGWLSNWPYNPEDELRVFRGNHGREILQVRLPLGIEQYELEGRPDGHEPRGVESLLDFHLARLEAVKAKGEDDGFTLSPEECAELFQEGTLYYYRYLRLFQMRDWRRSIRDTARNLRLFDFIHRYAEREEDQMYLEQWRPYLIRMNAMAQSLYALETDKHDDALQIVRNAIGNIERLDEIDDDTFRHEKERSLHALQEMVEHIDEIRPVPELERLQRELDQAIALQAFERAATLRDRIRNLRSKATGSINT